MLKDRWKVGIALRRSRRRSVTSFDKWHNVRARDGDVMEWRETTMIAPQEMQKRPRASGVRLYDRWRRAAVTVSLYQMNNCLETRDTAPGQDLKVGKLASCPRWLVGVEFNAPLDTV